MKKNWFVAVFVMVWIASCSTGEQQTEKKEKITSSSIINNPGVNARVVNLMQYPAGSVGFPRCLEPTGEVRKVPSTDWTSGFFPGVLWYAYEYTGDEAYKKLAAEWTVLVEPEKTNDRTHDMGFKINCSFGNGYRIVGDEQYHDVIIESARTLSTRFNESVGCTRSWDFNRNRWDFPVIIDNMMNLELLFLATELTGDSSYYHMAYQHAMTTLDNHFREDYSSWHVVDYDPEDGQVNLKETHQGYSDSSAWARGQAWGLYGFTMAYRFTREQKFLNLAKNIADFIFNHPRLPDDLIPYWDYDAPDLADQPRDASAAAITASALYELSGYLEDDDMVSYADAILRALSSNSYLVDSDQDHPFILKHSTGNMPKEDEIDVPIIYADYYFLEALLRQKELKEKQ